MGLKSAKTLFNKPSSQRWDTSVYKFKSQTQLLLLAYEFDPKTRHLLLLGSHENFYRELKR